MKLLISFFIILIITANLFADGKKITLAVLYFENNSIVDKDKMDPLKKGIADMLITELTNIKAFKVVERERLNDILEELKLNQSGAVDPSSAQKVGKLLGAKTLLLGSFVNFIGNKFRIDLRIIETETGLTLKAEEVTDDIDDLFDIIKDLTEKVTQNLDIELSDTEKTVLETKQGTVSVEASLLYSRAVGKEDEARDQYKKGNMEGALQLYGEAMKLYETALQKDPGLTAATSKLSGIIGLITEIKLPQIKVEKTDPPQVSILQPTDSDKGGVVSTEKDYTLKIKAKDETGIDKVLVNGLPIKDEGNGEYNHKVTLNGGENDFSIVVTNKKGVTTEKQVMLIYPQTDSTTISLIEPAVKRGIKLVSKKDVLTVRGTVVDQAGVRQVKVNSREAEIDARGNFSIAMNLEPGDNQLKIQVLNGKQESTTKTFTITRNVEEMLSSGKYYALVIGINSYTGYWHPLKNALNDAKGVGELLKSDYKFDSVVTMLDAEATRRNIIQQLEWFANNLTPDDNLLIFYSGHGQLNKILNKGYWIPVDATSNSVADYISNSDIKTFLKGIPGKHIFLITDACFAGDIFRGDHDNTSNFDPNNMEKYYKEVYRKQSRLALTSGGVEEVMDAGKDGHSVFTYYLLQALKNNDKKYIDAAQLFNEFRTSVVNNSEQTPQLSPVRDTNDEGGQFVFIKK